jgi:hypothetical protein
MSRYESYLRDRQEQAHQARGDAEAQLVTQLDNGEALSVAVAAVARTRAVSRWWDTAVTAVDHEGLDPVDALVRTREAARHVLTDQASPRTACPFAQGFATAAVEAARTFYQDTAHLDEITVRRAS